MLARFHKAVRSALRTNTVRVATSVDPRPRSLLTVTELERRDTAGSLLDVLLAAALGGARPDPLDALPAILGGPPVVGILVS